MSTSHHREAFLAFEGNESLVSGLQSKIAHLKRQQQDYKVEADCYECIHSIRNLRDAEAAVTKQIVQACSRVLEHVQKEDGHNDELCIDPTSRADAIMLLNDAITDAQLPAQNITTEQRSGLVQVVRDIMMVEKQSSATSLADLRAKLAISLGEIDRMCTVLSDEIMQHRSEVTSMTSNGECDNMQQLPASISRAIDSLRTLLKDNHAEDCGEIDVLEQCLREKFESVHMEYTCAFDDVSIRTPPCWDEKSQIIYKKAVSRNGMRSLSCLVDRLKKELPGKSEREINEYIEYRNAQKANKQRAEAAAGDLKRKCQSLESEGLQEIENLREEFNSRIRTNKGRAETELKRKEMMLRLKAMHLERDEIQKTSIDKETLALSEKAGDEWKELHRAQLMLKNRQAIIQHQTRQVVESQKENCATELKNDFVIEIESLKRQQVNRQRSIFREAQMNNKLLEQKMADEAASRAEKARLEKLNNLATNVPYYNSITEKVSDIYKTTQARKNDVYEGRSMLADFQCGNLKGFTNERIFSDAKFRYAHDFTCLITLSHIISTHSVCKHSLGNALHEAGVARSTYARDKVREVIPRSEERTTGIKPY